MTTPGKLLQNQALDYLNSFPGFFFWQNDSVGLKGRKRLNRYRPNGLPDIMGVMKGQTAFVEIKHGYDKLSETQIETIERLRQNGAKVLVAKTLEDVIEWVGQWQ